MRLTGILVPTDFSPGSRRALEYAVALAKPLRTRLLVVHALEPIYFASPADLSIPSANVSLFVQQRRLSAGDQLARLQRDLKKRRVAVHTILASGPPHQVILDTARKRRTGLIVMSTHGRTGVRHLVMGSVAEKVVRGASCPVLTLRAASRVGVGRGRRTRG